VNKQQVLQQVAQLVVRHIHS